jgi:endoglucanase
MVKRIFPTIPMTHRSLLIATIALSTVTLTSCTNATAKAKQIKPTQVYPVRSDILAIEIDMGKVTHATQQPYKSALGDQIEQPRPKTDTDWVKTPMGGVKGALVGNDRKLILGFDQLQGQELEVTTWKRPTAVLIRSTDDPNYDNPQQAISIHRKTKPRDVAQVDTWKFAWALNHTFYLELPKPLVPGKTYQLSFADRTLAPVSFQHQPKQQRSEAIQVSHLGFRPGDPGKVAFLSSWMGDGGGVSYPPDMPFTVIDDRSNQPVFSGKTKLSRRQSEPEDDRNRNYVGSDVYVMDFSKLNQAGKYRICVGEIGCSFPFTIAQNVWDNPFYVSIRGLYHQRAGISIGQPYSNYKRPRAFHPADGVKIYQATARLVDNDQGLPGLPAFRDVLPQTKTSEIVPNSWGGYFDAGDWDRRIQHVAVSRSLFELAEMFPDYFDRVNLNIPESKNQLPDTIDEALWTLDFFRRLQTADGGIRGGIQSINYPKYGEASWQESMDVLAYAPDPWSSYLYAAGAAQAAYWLHSRDPKLAQDYRDSALRAMEYAERESSKPSEPSRKFHDLWDARNLAALSLWRLSAVETASSNSGSKPGSKNSANSKIQNSQNPNQSKSKPTNLQAERWENIFLESTVFRDPNAAIAAWKIHDHKDAAFLYQRIPASLIQSSKQSKQHQQYRQNARNAIIKDADRALKNTQTSAHRWAKEGDGAPIGYGHSYATPKTTSLLRAHFLSQEPKYFEAAMLASQFALGANPINLNYTTGLGHRSPKRPLINDQRITNQAPPPGITVYGPLDPVDFKDEWFWGLMEPALYPAIGQWPATETYFDIYLAPAINEFTVMQTIGPSAYTWGYFAAQGKR